MKDKELICKICKIGCHIKYENKDNELIITGYRCERGHLNAHELIKQDSYVIKSRCLLTGASLKHLPVTTNKPVSPELVQDILDIIRATTVKAPIRKGQTIISNVMGSGIDVIAQRKVTSLS